MKKSRFTERQIAFALQQAEAGTAVLGCAGKWGSQNRPSTDGRRSSEG